MCLIIINKPYTISSRQKSWPAQQRFLYHRCLRPIMLVSKRSPGTSRRPKLPFSCEQYITVMPRGCTFFRIPYHMYILWFARILGIIPLIKNHSIPRYIPKFMTKLPDQSQMIHSHPTDFLWCSWSLRLDLLWISLYHHTILKQKNIINWREQPCFTILYSTNPLSPLFRHWYAS